MLTTKWPITRRTGNLFICPMFEKTNIPDFVYQHCYDIVSESSYRHAQVVVYSAEINSFFHPEQQEIVLIVKDCMKTLESEGIILLGFWTERIVKKIDLTCHPDRYN